MRRRSVAFGVIGLLLPSLLLPVAAAASRRVLLDATAAPYLCELEGPVALFTPSTGAQPWLLGPTRLPTFRISQDALPVQHQLVILHGSIVTVKGTCVPSTRTLVASSVSLMGEVDAALVALAQLVGTGIDLDQTAASTQRAGRRLDEDSSVATPPKDGSTWDSAARRSRPPPSTTPEPPKKKGWKQPPPLPGPPSSPPTADSPPSPPSPPIPRRPRRPKLPSREDLSPPSSPSPPSPPKPRAPRVPRAKPPPAVALEPARSHPPSSPSPPSPPKPRVPRVPRAKPPPAASLEPPPSQPPSQPPSPRGRFKARPPSPVKPPSPRTPRTPRPSPPPRRSPPSPPPPSPRPIRSPPPPRRSPPPPSPPPTRSPPPKRSQPPPLRTSPSPTPNPGPSAGVIQPRSGDLGTNPAPVWPQQAGARRFTSLVLIVDLCGKGPNFDSDYMRMHWSNQYSGGRGPTLEDMVTKCSYGKWAYEPQDNLVLPVRVQVPCSGTGSMGPWTSRDCRDVDRMGWAEAAMDWVRKNTDIDPSAFVHRILMLPLQTANCNPALAALAMQNCAWSGNCFVWSFGEPNPRSLLHEIGHNLGLFHAWTYWDLNQYGDTAAIMGSGPSPMCWNAAQSEALGISRPIAEVAGSDLRAGTWLTIKLPPTFLTDVNYVRIATTWMADPNFKAGYVYLSYKLASPNAGDAGLSKKDSQHVHIHSYLGNPSIQARNYTMLLGTVTAGDTWPSPTQVTASRYPWRLLVTSVETPPYSSSSVEDMLATVQVCRFISSPSECGSAPLASGASTRSAAAADDSVRATSGASASAALTDAALRSASADFCGDGVCGSGEDAPSCPVDCCASASAATCGDGVCDAWAGESCSSCPQDCARVRTGGQDILPFWVEPSGHIDFESHSRENSGSGPQWYCCGGGDRGQGCGVAACSAAGKACQATCAAGGGPASRHRHRSLLGWFDK
ncbi:hypothetical protein HYH03_004928 [Edaphochlamys debaryana]|uniref:Peptidase M11 gametolysin domain-containing protein n=1 Tax=Edaphochlamys debaryana TaxID=47281 RepID=A0A835Y5W4_9CHLO|nr:hypothetical protein HYH03_004928 [Edaphochlamys debaryana]|eukprot:KAG2496922.1 hypothetical protein HYH03_004928 [Edaphochlamys debaryana]